jgi:antitoxin (DNA-binding transcriptional repressor) of toxin-antitoxin stability system
MMQVTILQASRRLAQLIRPVQSGGTTPTKRLSTNRFRFQPKD